MTDDSRPPVSARRTVLVVGGYGVFGGRLVRLLARTPEWRVLVAGRSRNAALRFCQRWGVGEPLAFDREGDLADQLSTVRPAVVVDAAGPFQLYGSDPYRLARAAIAVSAHYLDLADDAAFVAGIGVLDAEARAAGRTVLSGVSSVPAISSAVVETLREGFTRIEQIESVILPGNRAPRGLSVVRAIAAQAGQPLPLWRGGRWQTVPGWSGAEPCQLTAAGHQLDTRSASFIGAPDLVLFPARYGARSVLFRAGLELRLLHRGLALLTWLPRSKLVQSLAPVARPLKFFADLLRPFGQDRGGMTVTVIGENAARCHERRQWTLIAEAGDGPFIPAVPAFAWLHHHRQGQPTVPGARSCVGELSLAQLAVGFGALKVVAEQLRAPAPTLFETALGPGWSRLPTVVRALHGAVGEAEYTGMAQVENGSHPLARLARWTMRLPLAADSVPVQVRLTATPQREHWVRQFGASRFQSTLRWNPAKRRLTEQFGLLRFALGLTVDDAGVLRWPVTQGWCCGLPLPRFLLPISESTESVDAEGRFRFDVSIRLGGVGLVAHYRGWLQPGQP